MTSEHWDRRYTERDLLWGTEPNRFLEQEAQGLGLGRALDLGCGEGRNAIWLAERGWRVTAVDFSNVALDRARGMAFERGVQVEWIHADLLDFSPAPAAFVLVVVLYLHLPPDQRRDVLEKAVTAMAPGATVIVVGHDARNLAEGYGGPQDRSLLYSPAEIAAELGGLDIERAESVIRPVSIDGREVTAIDALVRARKPAAVSSGSPVTGRPMLEGLSPSG